MITKITEDVRIRYEDKNYTIERRRVVQEGKNAGMEVWDALGHHGSYRSAAQSLLTRHFHLLVGDATIISDLKGLIDAVDYGADLVARACGTAR